MDFLTFMSAVCFVKFSYLNHRFSAPHVSQRAKVHYVLSVNMYVYILQTLQNKIANKQSNSNNSYQCKVC